MLGAGFVDVDGLVLFILAQVTDADDLVGCRFFVPSVSHSTLVTERFSTNKAPELRWRLLVIAKTSRTCVLRVWCDDQGLVCGVLREG